MDGQPRFDDSPAADDEIARQGQDSAVTGEILLAGAPCKWPGNVSRCTGAADASVGQALRALPTWTSPEGPLNPAVLPSDAVTFHNPFAEGFDKLSGTINKTEDLLMTEKVYKGNSAIKKVQEKLTGANLFQNEESYRELVIVGTAGGEQFLRLGSRVPVVDPQLEDPAYVLTDKDFYDLGSTALDDLYSASAAMQKYAEMPGVNATELDFPKQRIGWDINRVLDNQHDMNKIVDEMSGPVYKQYADRFDSWKAAIKDKYDHPDEHMFDVEALDPNMVDKYKAKQERDLVVIDMALIKNNAGNREELISEINNSLSVAHDLDGSNPDLPQLQTLAPHN